MPVIAVTIVDQTVGVTQVGEIGLTGDTGPTGTVSAAGDGTAGAPGIAFASDTNTGIFRPSADVLSITTGGVTRARFDAAAVRIGTRAMPSMGTAGTYNFAGANIAIGLDAGFSNVEGGMVAIGWEAAYSAGAVGDESAVTAVGWRALKLTTTGHATGFGWGAGQRNTTGHIVVVGDEALSFNTTSNSVAVGYYAGHSNVTGEVTAIGYQAGRLSGPATTMTLVGYDSGYYNTSATLTAVGHRAALNTTSGSDNSAFGHEALLNNTTGSSNTAAGINALFDNISGYELTAVGSNAGRSVLTANQSTFIGSSAGYNGLQKTDVSNSIAIGYGAITTYDNETVIGNSSTTRFTAHGFLGANGKTNPQYPLDVLAASAAGIAANIKNGSGYGLTLRINDGSDTLGYGENYRHSVQYGGGEGFAIVDGTTPRVVVAATTGKVGVGTGTTTPPDRLSVFGDISIRTADAIKVGSYGTISETVSGLAYITGNVIKAHPTTADTLIKTASDPANFIGMRYDRGISFHTNITGASGSTAADNANQRMLIGLDGKVGIATPSPEYALDVAGPIGFTPGASVTPAQNGDVVFELTSNTSLTVKAKGSDGTVRSVVLTLA